MEQPERMVMSVQEVARELNVAPSTVYGLIERGQIPSRRLGDEKTGRIVIPRELFRYWLLTGELTMPVETPNTDPVEPIDPDEIVRKTQIAMLEAQQYSINQLLCQLDPDRLEV